MGSIKNLPAHAMLTLDSGEKREVVRLGSGRFTVAWRSVAAPEVVYLLVNDADSSKELLQNCQGPHVPELDRVGMIENYGSDHDTVIFKSRYYLPLTAKSTAAWKQFRKLEKHWSETWKETCPEMNHRRDYARTVQVFTDAVQEDETILPTVREAIDRVATWAQSYDYSMEIAKRNLAVDERGDLILLDPVYSWRFIEEQQKKARAKRYAFA